MSRNRCDARVGDPEDQEVADVRAGGPLIVVDVIGNGPVGNAGIGRADVALETRGADEGRGAFPLALKVAADRTRFHVVAVIVHRDGLENEPEYGGALKAALGHGFNDFT